MRQRSISKGEGIVEDIRNAGGEAFCVVADVMDKESLLHGLPVMEWRRQQL